MSHFLTTPIYYVNARPHLGHGCTTIFADALTRFHRLFGGKSLLITGTDEHGDKIVQAAAKAGREPKAFTDEISGIFRSLWPKLDIDPGLRFVRTTDPEHERAVQAFLQRVHDAGDIYFGEFGGHYCTGCERFYTEKELVNGLCPQHETRPEFISEKNWFFRMSKYLPAVRAHIADHPDFIMPERYRNEALGMLDSGDLGDLCISRPRTRLTWGVELPFDRDYVTYVWFDALIAYISPLGMPEGDGGGFWPGEHLIAKDILKPHAVFWPAMLMAAGLPLPRRLRVHGYWLSRDTKMSKSLGNVVDPAEMAERYGVDAFRCFLMREMRFGSDASFSEEAIIGRINADLANDLGNLFSRVLSMAGRFCGSRIPEGGRMTEDDEAIRELAAAALDNWRRLFGDAQFSSALESVWELIRALNKYVDSQAPWALHKAGETARLGTVMQVLLTAMRKTALCLWPVMPRAATAMLAQLGENPPADAPPVAAMDAEIDSFAFLKPGTALAAASNLFPRIEPPKREEAPARPKAQKQAKPEKKAEPVPAADGAEIAFDHFKAVRMRVGTVLTAEKHPDADRILVLKIDFGEGAPRQILSGLAEFYAPEDLPGRQVCAVLNLAPRKIRGLVSNGMVLTAQQGDRVVLLQPGGEVPNGSEIA